MFTLTSTAGVPAQGRTVFQAALASNSDKAPVVNAQQSSLRVLNSAVETIEFSKAEQERQRKETALEKERSDHEFAEQKVDDQAAAAEAAKDDKLEKLDAKAESAKTEKVAEDEHIDVFA
jgi:hypothetical protein